MSLKNICLTEATIPEYLSFSRMFGPVILQFDDYRGIDSGIKV